MQLQGLLNQREKISKQLGPNANEITIINRYRNTWFKDVWNVTSELLFAAICGESGFRITFDPYAIDHDYDFIVNGYPVQVKSSNKSYSSFSAAADAKKKRKGDVDDNKVKYDLAINKVLHTIDDNTSSIDDALEQGAKIVFLNGTTDDSGSYLSQYCIETQNSFYIEKALGDSISLLKRTDFLFH
jgi:hypothetical protein